MDFLDNPHIVPYTVKETHYFLEQMGLLVSRIERWDEIKETIDLDLARNPRAGMRIPDTQLYAVTVLSEPPLTVYYTIDDQAQILTLVEVHLF